MGGGGRKARRTRDRNRGTAQKQQEAQQSHSLVCWALFQRLQHQLGRPTLHLAVQDDEPLKNRGRMDVFWGEWGGGCAVVWWCFGVGVGCDVTKPAGGGEDRPLSEQLGVTSRVWAASFMQGSGLLTRPTWLLLVVSLPYTQHAIAVCMAWCLQAENTPPPFLRTRPQASHSPSRLPPTLGTPPPRHKQSQKTSPPALLPLPHAPSPVHKQHPVGRRAAAPQTTCHDCRQPHNHTCTGQGRGEAGVGWGVATHQVLQTWQ